LQIAGEMDKKAKAKDRKTILKGDLTMAEIKSDVLVSAMEYAKTLADKFDDNVLEVKLAIRANLANRLYRAIYYGELVTSEEIKKIIAESKAP
jgi:hypothetical protein